MQFFAERPRSRYFLGDELPKFFKALNEEPNETFRRLLPARPPHRRPTREVQSMRWMR